MGFLNCPNCARRLRVPDSLAPMDLRCPACRQSFRSDGPVQEEPPAPDQAQAGEDPTPSAQAASGRILSQADEAMLRDYGSGSGLMELTRSAFTGSAPASPPAGPEPDGLPEPMPARNREDLDRQFQVIGTALTLANKLVRAHKSELRRTRRHATLGWAMLGAMTVAAAIAGWWGMRQSGQVDLDRVEAVHLSGKLGDANTRLAEELASARTERRIAEANLVAARNELRTLGADLATTRASLAEKKSAADALAAELKVADARIAVLAAEANRLEADLAAARADLKASQTDLAAQRDGHKAATTQLSATSRSAAPGQDAQDALAAQLKSANAKIAALTAQAEASRTALAADANRLETELVAARAELKAAQADLADQRDGHKSATTQLAETRKSLAERQDAVDTLAKELEAAKARIAALTAQDPRLRTNLTDEGIRIRAEMAAEEARLRTEIAAARGAGPALAEANSPSSGALSIPRGTSSSQPATAPAASAALRPASPIFPPPPARPPAGSGSPGRE